MIIQIEIPDSIPEGHGASFKKGVAEALIKNATTLIDHTPNGHEKSRELGKSVGEKLTQEISKIVKPQTL